MNPFIQIKVTLTALLLTLFTAVEAQEKEKKDQKNNDKSVMQTSGSPETTRLVVPEDVVVPEGKRLQVVTQGSYLSG